MFRHLLVALIAALTLSACTRHTPEKADQGTAVAAAPSVPEPWYENEIKAFEQADRESPPQPGAVLFVGSSSIRMWTTLERDMEGWSVLNRGFGGSKTPEVLAVIDRIVLPYKPSMIVYYCGDNDLGESNTDSAVAAQGFIAFCERVHKRQPQATILYLAIKPSLARWSNWEAMRRANELVAAYAAQHDHVEFVDVASCLLGPDGTPDPTLYAPDGLHLSAAGYEHWTPIVRERLTAARKTPPTP